MAYCAGFASRLTGRRQRLLLTPGALLDVPYDYDLTGFTIVSNGRAFAVDPSHSGRSHTPQACEPGTEGTCGSYGRHFGLMAANACSRFSASQPR
jgi:hypothetical protein